VEDGIGVRGQTSGGTYSTFVQKMREGCNEDGERWASVVATATATAGV